MLPFFVDSYWPITREYHNLFPIRNSAEGFDVILSSLEYFMLLRNITAESRGLNQVSSRFAHLEKFSLNFSSSLFVIRVYLLHLLSSLSLMVYYYLCWFSNFVYLKLCLICQVQQFCPSDNRQTCCAKKALRTVQIGKKRYFFKSVTHTLVCYGTKLEVLLF